VSMHPTPRPPIRRELNQLMERPGWVHHVADAATGELLTTQLPQPVAPLSRAERLSRLGHQFDPSIFGAWTYRLTTRHPYQASPLGFLRFLWADDVHALGMGGPPEDEGYAFWWVAEQGDKVGEMDAVLFEPPQGRCLLSIYLGINNEPGQAGPIRIEVAKGADVIASFQLAAHGDGWLFNTFDLVFVPVPGNWIRMFLQPQSGLRAVYFYSLILAPQRPDIRP
jgi:hypothetical protein